MVASMSMGVLDKAQELADAISTCDELAVLKRAAERIDTDETASTMLREFQEKQATTKQAGSAGLQLPPEHTSEMQSLQGRIDSNQFIQDFAQAQGNFNDLIERVNDIIAAAVLGMEQQEDEPEHHSHEHGPGCRH